MNAIEINNLTKDFGHGRGIFNVNFAVKKGEVFGFLGPNGAGKTTTIRHLMGFTQPDQGSSKILGLDASKNYAKIMENIGYLPGEINLPEGLTGWQFIRMMQKMRKSENDDYLNYLLKRFELDPEGSTKKMSLGNKRKLAIVTAFMNDPEVLILDEPTSGLDPVMQEQFVQYMIEEKKRGKTILLSSHIFPEIEATCDRIAIIKDGRLISEIDASTLKNEDEKKYALQVSSKTELNLLKKQLHSINIQFNPVGMGLEISTRKEKLNELFSELSQFKITKFKEIHFNLEEYFLDFYRSDKLFKGLEK
ncbi:ABC transporter ATP-binding protein [Enterococcus hermanniensis]|uniref:ABC transporter ATP-binding protein n=1 Tax=Enterococcus hermanniensis TaxID=249189 RepID=A0A1L8TPQ7_9ENTE|nr:ABC transporter ATP-binding protein [Enterococcus hermanniensis]OJG46260.1 ABC transporter ATP-binding protein [Enterococcus hermanniensis]